MKTSLLTSLKGNMGFKAGEGFIPTAYNWAKPSSWPELRKITPQKGISFLLSDKYPYAAFSATCVGGYEVLIDGTIYGTFGSSEKCTVTLDDIEQNGSFVTYPEPLKVHIVIIKPTISQNNISAFRMLSYSDNIKEEEGLLWVDFNLESVISLENCFYIYQKLYCPDLEVITSRNNILKVSNMANAFNSASKLSYLPILKGENFSSEGFNYCFTNDNANIFLKRIRLQDISINGSMRGFVKGCTNLELIETSNCNLNPSYLGEAYRYCRNLKFLPSMQYSNLISAPNFLIENYNLSETEIDLSSAHSLQKVDICGSGENQTVKLKRLKVSSSAPFDGNSPQIDISFTELDKNALKELFESLPLVSAGQKIDIAGTVGSSELTQEDIAIAVNKGWEVLQ